jgi:hypothetical protein
MFRIGIIIFALILSSCATGTKTILSDKKITEPKVIALDAPRTPWVVEIENRLRQNGFKVLRWASQKHVKEKVSETRVEEFKEASTRYVLSIEGFAPLDAMHKCFGGGYNFEYLTVELIDVQSNETIMSTSGSGYSEGCAPLSGTIFRDVVSSVEGAWK